LTIDTTAVAHLLAALATLLVAAHALGALFARFRQPRVIGEIAAGLVLGPTLLGHVAPGAESRLFPAAGVTPTVLGAVYQLGLLLLLFCSGAQIRAGHRRGENKTVGWVFSVGTILPFLAGLGLLHVLDLRSSWGPHANAASFLLIFAIAMAVTSIPVISKIMHDLGILDTSFAGGARGRGGRGHRLVRDPGGVAGPCSGRDGSALRVASAAGDRVWHAR